MQTGACLSNANPIRGVMIGLQAGMWDPPATAAAVGGFTPIVQALASRTAAF